MVVYCSQVVWDDVWQRPQELSIAIAKKRPLIYVSTIQLHHWLKHSKSITWFKQTYNDVTVVTILLIPGHYTKRLIFLINTKIVSLYLRLIFRSANSIDLLTDTPFLFPAYNTLLNCHNIMSFHYDIIDDFVAFNWAPTWGRAFESEMLQYVVRSVTTGTQSLKCEKERLFTKGPVTFIPLGVRFDEFDITRLHGDKAVIGYIGSVNDRLDYELITMLAERFPDAKIQFVGPIRILESALPRRENIEYLGLRKHEELPQLMSHFTVAIIPFKIDDATTKLFPVKALEYLAAGLPTVSVNLPEITSYFNGLIEIAETKQDFCDMVGKLISSNNEDADREKKEFARKHTWEQMSDSIISHIIGF